MLSHKLPGPRQSERLRKRALALDPDEKSVLAEPKHRKTHPTQRATDTSSTSTSSPAASSPAALSLAASSTDTSPTDTSPKLLGIPAELRNDIYDLVSNDVNTAFYVLKDKKLTCIHPLAQACKTTRGEFLGRLEGKVIGNNESQPPQSITIYNVFKVQNFNFEKAMTILRRSSDIQRTLRRVYVRICHDITTSDPSTTSLVSWTEFVESHRHMLGAVDHKVVSAPAPDSRPNLIRNIAKLKALSNLSDHGKTEAENFEAGFKQWWDGAAGKYKWVSDEEIKEMGAVADKKDWMKRVRGLKKVGKNQHPDDDSDFDERQSDSDGNKTDYDVDEDDDSDDDSMDESG